MKKGLEACAIEDWCIPVYIYLASQCVDQEKSAEKGSE